MISRTRLALALSVALGLTAKTLPAQVAVYGMGSGVFLGAGASNGSLHTYGFTLGVYDNIVRLGPLKLGGDARYFQGTSSGSGNYTNKIVGALVGPRLTLSLPLIPFKPFIQAEVGDAATNYGYLSNLPNSLAYQIQGGLDFTIFPHLDLRAEYGGGQINRYGGDGKQSLQEAGLGAVVRF